MLEAESYAKINLTLRVVGKNPSGFHELSSIFLKIGPVDHLTIRRGMEDNVKVIFKRLKSIIEGRNILLKTLDAIRATGADVPPLEILLEKNIPPGTGLGCGSGDAAALLGALAARGVSALHVSSRIGADVPFLCSGARAALAEGIGEKLRVLDGVPDLTVAVVIPEWRCPTGEMFGRLDGEFASGWPLDSKQARAEALELLRRLRDGAFCGLLPNDFCAVLLKERREYETLFDAFAAHGALAWGISGSGSAAFALWNRERFKGFRTDFPWVRDVLIF